MSNKAIDDLLEEVLKSVKRGLVVLDDELRNLSVGSDPGLYHHFEVAADKIVIALELLKANNAKP